MGHVIQFRRIFLLLFGYVLNGPSHVSKLRAVLKTVEDCLTCLTITFYVHQLYGR